MFDAHLIWTPSYRIAMAESQILRDLHPTEESEEYEDSDLDRTDVKRSAKPLDNLDEDFSSDDEQATVFHSKKKPTKVFNPEESDEDSEGEHSGSESEAEVATKKLDETSAMVKEQQKRSKKLKKLTPEQLAKEQKKIKKSGVCYLSSIPPYMKPVKLRSILSQFGKLDRIFLKPEDHSSHQKRVKYGGNKKKRYTEGWVEFVKKKDAKLCAQTMNGNILGGKKSSYYHDDIINIKYLPGFKWFDLTQQISKENEIRQAKLAMEISQQAKLDKSFVNNVERSKYVNRKRKAAGDKAEEPNAKRTFDQKSVSSTRADANVGLKRDKPSDDLDSVLSKVF